MVPRTEIRVYCHHSGHSCRRLRTGVGISVRRERARRPPVSLIVNGFTSYHSVFVNGEVFFTRNSDTCGRRLPAEARDIKPVRRADGPAGVKIRPYAIYGFGVFAYRRRTRTRIRAFKRFVNKSVKGDADLSRTFGTAQRGRLGQAAYFVNIVLNAVSVRILNGELQFRPRRALEAFFSRSTRLPCFLCR